MSTPRPGVLVWQRIYCAVMTLLYLVVLGAGVVLLVVRGFLEDDPEVEMVQLVYGVICTGLGAVLAPLYGAGVVLTPRRWVWVYHIVLISIGMASPCILPFGIALLVFWVMPATRAYFGWEPAAPSRDRFVYE
jgi:hypothetical protein